MPVTPDPLDPALSIFDAIGAAIVKALREWPALSDGSLIGVRDIVFTADTDFQDAFPDPPSGPDVQLFVIQSGQGGMGQAVTAGGPAGVMLRQRYSLLVTAQRIHPVKANRVNEATLDALLAKGFGLGIMARGVTGWQMTWADLLAESSPAPQQLPAYLTRYQRLADVVVDFRRGGLNTRPAT